MAAENEDQKKSKHSYIAIVTSIIGGLFVVIAACITVFGPFIISKFEGSGLSPTTQPQLSNPISSPAATTVVGNTSLPVSTVTLSPTVLPSPSATLSPTALPSGFEFFDDFEFGLSDQWEIQYGQLGMVDGKLTVITPSTGTQTYHFITLRELNWGDVTVEVELASFNDLLNGTTSDGVGAIVLHQSVNSQAAGLMFYPRYEGMEFGIFSDDGEWSPLPTSFISGLKNGFDLYNSVHTIKMVSRGDTYIVYIDNRKITSATISGNDVGEIGLWFRTSTHDDVEFYAPRIESIRITSNQP